MLPTPAMDVWALASEADWRKALALLDRLPSRATSSAEFDQQVYFIALNGTTRYGLSKAVEAILQNALDHAFFPSPPEFRGQCDKAMRPYEEQRDREMRRKKLAEERAAYQSVQRRSPDDLARAKRVYDDFCAGYEKQAVAFVPTLDPDLVAQVPDNPKARERIGIQE